MLLRFATELGINDARSEAATLAPLPGLLSRMNVQIVVGPSTLIMQAAQYGVPSVAIGVGSEEAEKLFPAEFASGMIRVASTAEELSQHVTVLSERKRPPARLPVPRAEMVGMMKELISRRGAGLRRVRERPSETLVTESAV